MQSIPNLISGIPRVPPEGRVGHYQWSKIFRPNFAINKAGDIGGGGGLKHPPPQSEHHCI